MLARLVTAVRAEWRGVGPVPGRRVYYANHASHGDFVLIWTVLPAPTRPARREADYRLASPMRRFVGRHVFDAVLIEQCGGGPAAVEAMAAALDDGSLLILFPEGARNLTDATLLPVRPGLYHLAAARPDVDLVLVWIENLNRVMPKGEVVPVPLLCRVRFGAPLRPERGEARDAFLARAREALHTLAATITTVPAPPAPAPARRSSPCLRGVAA